MYPSAIDLSPPLRFVDDVTPVLLDWRRAGLAGVLVTLVGIEGASPRPLGSQMAVNERGDWVGQISSDCAEAAIAREAIASLADRRSRSVRYGRGSKYLDVRLPCGSGLDIHFDPCVPLDVLEALETGRRARRPVALISPWHAEGEATPAHCIEEICRDGPRSDLEIVVDTTSFARRYWPQTRVVVVGRGAYAASLVSFVHALGWEACLLTPDVALIEQHAHHCRLTGKLSSARDFDAALIDPWTATVLLFHDHTWEPDILAHALKAGGFYVGALGSRATHSRRLEELAKFGVSAAQARRIHGPVGLDVGARTPPEIALSIAGEIVAARRTVSRR